MSLYDDIKMIGLGSMGSELATLIERYKRDDKKERSLTDDERNTLKKAIKFVRNMKDGYAAVIEVHNFNINSEAPGSYNYYIRVRKQLPELGLVNNASEIGKEINMFAEILNKLNQEKSLAEIGKDKLAKVGVFFSRLSDFTMEQLYVLNNEKRELDSI